MLIAGELEKGLQMVGALIAAAHENDHVDTTLARSLFLEVEHNLRVLDSARLRSRKLATDDRRFFGLAEVMGTDAMQTFLLVIDTGLITQLGSRTPITEIEVIVGHRDKLIIRTLVDAVRYAYTSIRTLQSLKDLDDAFVSGLRLRARLDNIRLTCHEVRKALLYEVAHLDVLRPDYSPD